MFDGYGGNPQFAFSNGLKAPDLLRTKAIIRHINKARLRHEQAPYPGLQQVQRAERKVVDVHMRDQRHVDRWKIACSDSWLHKPPGEACSYGLGEYRVRQYPLIVELEQYGCMPYPKRGQPDIAARRVADAIGHRTRLSRQRAHVALEDLRPNTTRPHQEKGGQEAHQATRLQK